MVGADQRLEHPLGAQEEVAGDHVIAAVTAASAPPKNPKAEAARVDEPPHRAVTAAKRAVDPDHRSGPRAARRDPLPAPAGHQAGRAADHRPNLKAEAAVERLKELLDAKNQIRDETRGETADEAAEPAADRRPDHFRDEKGLFVQGNPGGPGRPRGSKNILPRGSRKMMKKLIAGRLTQDGRPIATIMVDLFFQGLQGGVVLRRNAKTTTYVNPATFLKLFLDYMLKIREQALKAKAAKINSKGSSGGIRVVLLNPIADPLLRPGQTPRPLRLLGQDPSKPVEAAGRAPRQRS